MELVQLVKDVPEDPPLKKENAENALNSLFSTLEDYLWQNERKAA